MTASAMTTAAIEHTLMPNTYVKLLTQEFSQLDVITAGTGLVADELAAYPHPISVRQHLQCVENVLPLRQSPDWHLQWGKRMAENFHGAVTLAWLTAPTLGDGLDAFIKYMPSRVPYLDWQGSSDGNVFRCEVEELIDLGPVRHTLTEVPLIVMHEYIRVMRHGTIDAARIELTYPPPVHCYLYANWFECPIKFERPRNALVIPASWRAVPNVDFDESAWNASINRCEAQCKTNDERDVLARVREALFRFLEQPAGAVLPKLEHVAELPHVSPRTLIRRLRAMNTTFQDVSDEVLKQRASELLGNEANRMHDIAARLGYSDPGGFRRAFKRWYGTTPGAYRSRLLARTTA